MPRSASVGGLAKRGVIPRKQFYIKLFFFNTVILCRTSFRGKLQHRLDAFLAGGHERNIGRAARLAALGRRNENRENQDRKTGAGGPVLESHEALLWE